LTGDSAGGNLTVQALLHILHPVEDLPTLPNDEESKFAGVYLMSPWLTLLPHEESSQKSFDENATWDVVSPSVLKDSGQGILSGIKDTQHLKYIDSYFAPSGWYDDMGAVVKKMLITAGGHECMREDIIEFGKQVDGPDVKVVVDEYGVHDDPFFDFIAREKKLGELTPMIISWCHDAFCQ
jgi:acetyl esterase/lipase